MAVQNSDAMLSTGWQIFILAVCIVMGQTGYNVTMPLVADTLLQSGAPPYFVVWFASLSCALGTGSLLLAMLPCRPRLRSRQGLMLSWKAQKRPLQLGVLDALGGSMLVLASPSSRTPPPLQAVGANLIIPLTILGRALWLKQCPGRSELGPAAVIIAGLLISFKPTIYSMGAAAPAGAWPLCYMLGFVPVTFQIVLEETAVKHDNKSSSVLCIVFWTAVWKHLVVCALFWTDLVPTLGMSSDLPDFAHRFWFGWACAWHGGCGLWFALFFICFSVGFYISTALVLRYSPGAVWQVMVSSMSCSISTLFWAAFQPQPELHWELSWDQRMTYAMLGLVIILPANLWYSWAPGKVVAQRQDASAGLLV